MYGENWVETIREISSSKSVVNTVPASPSMELMTLNIELPISPPSSFISLLFRTGQDSRVQKEAIAPRVPHTI